MLTYSVCSSMTMHVRIQLLTPDHCWSISIRSLFDHPAPSDDLLFTYPRNCFGPQRFNNNELTGGAKTWLSLQPTSLTQTYKTLFPDTSASVLAVIKLSSSLNMFVSLVNNTFFLIAGFVNSSPEVTFRIALAYYRHIPVDIDYKNCRSGVLTCC
jgi:hypothetical protein